MLIFRDGSQSKKYFYKYFLLISNKFNTKKKSISLLILLSFLFSVLIIPFDLGMGKNRVRRLNKIAGLVTLPLRTANFQSGFYLREYILFGISISGLVKNYITSIPSEDRIIDLNISLKNYSKLNKLRKRAIKSKILTRTKNDEVNAKILFKGNEYPVKIRLKGDVVDHLLGEKWSYRIKTKKDEKFLGMKEFSLQSPRTRNYINEFLFHSMLKNEDLPYLRYDFISLRLNGKHLGTYALEEHFSKELIENSGYREGPIIKISESHMWGEWKRTQSVFGNQYSIPTGINLSPIEIFNSKRAFTNPSIKAQYAIAYDLLEKFLSNKISASEVFDIDKTAKFFAVIDSVGAHHANDWRNFRFYYDPVLARLIPIGFDAMISIREPQRSLAIDKNPLGIFDDQKFVSQYIHELERVSEKGYIEAFLNSMEREFKNKLKQIHKSYPHVRLLKEEFIKNQLYIRTRLTPFEPFNIQLAGKLNSSKPIIFNIHNNSKFPIKIKILSDTEKELKPINHSIIPPSDNLTRFKNHPVKFKLLANSSISGNNNLPGNTSFDLLDSLRVEYSLLGSKKVLTSETKLKPLYNPPILTTQIVNRNPNYKEFSFLNIDDKNNSITINNGVYILKKPLILPSGYSLELKPGVKIVLEENSFILIQGPIFSMGTETSPVEIDGNKVGKGVFILNASKKSKLSNTIFSNISSLKDLSVSLSGGVTFYNSPVEIHNSIFKNGTTEDALNLFRSDFIMSNVKFENTFSDALDIDFSNGDIKNASFRDIGNDAIDISGSEVTISDVYVDKAGDKGISLGEVSNLFANKINIMNTPIGIASKDLSHAKINLLNIQNSQICLTAYQKKSEYGPASIEILEHEDSSSCKNNYLLEPVSSIFFQGRSLLPNRKEVSDLLYGNIYGKKTIRD